jgi:hypothetical protein
MAKFNTHGQRHMLRGPLVALSPVRSESRPTGRTFEGGSGYARDTKGEVFLLAVSNMVGEDTFYETAGRRDDRYTQLVRQAAVTDPEWTAGFLRWLRQEANMRSAAIVGAAEFVKARLDVGQHGMNRGVISSVLVRADEPGEMLAYWTSRYGRNVPKPVKRGVADAASRLYTERNWLKWDSDARGFRFADVLELTHASPATQASWQGDLFRHIIDHRHGRAHPSPVGLRMVRANRVLRAQVVNGFPGVLLDAVRLREAGMTWEDSLSLAGPHVDKRQLWEHLIPTMGYMALLRNLRNFDQAGVSDQVARIVADRLADPDEVARSRQFPFRFYAAHTATKGSLRWGHALEKALRASLANVPALDGRTLVVVDQSPSMLPGYYFSTPNKSDITLADKAKLFGAAVALRAADANLVGYGSSHYPVEFRPGDAVLTVMDRFHIEDGTDTVRAVAENYRHHDRVLVITDEQTTASRYGRLDDVVPARVPLYTWNLAGYEHGEAPSGTRNRHAFGGLTDAAFGMIPLLEAGKSAAWPWQSNNADRVQTSAL